ncbi:hypothetical protein PPYC2_16510 [Paenibacillus polymyxa]|uniref:hypothetical protein n=1 Tax=Paenibacillus polymyxa TaxID=1406 RepID=UPI0008FBA22A|nr:hypothetical protein [Paenibacillus polymyxa]APB76465.1 hypothetical protein PPYC2_16510 [Paenibacillus polymyxa]
MPTPTQKKFNRSMAKIEKNSRKNGSEKVYSYIQDRYISDYYDREPKAKTRVKKLQTFKYMTIATIVVFFFICFVFAPFNRFAAIPFTTMVSAIPLLLLGIIHPSLAFMDGRSRITVIWIYVLIFIVSFIVAGLMLGVEVPSNSIKN